MVQFNGGSLVFKNLLIISVVTVGVLFGISALMDSAMSANDVNDAGATDNTQTNESGSNTAITGGYSSSSVTEYQGGSTSSTTTNNAPQIMHTLEILE